MNTNLLTLYNLKKTYGNKTAVNIYSLKILPHTFTCIVGKSGCGKTTLLRLLAGLEAPDAMAGVKDQASGSDSATWNGKDTVTNAKDQATASHNKPGQNKNTASRITVLPAKTAPVFQEPRLMPWLTVKENIMFSLKGTDGSKLYANQNQWAVSDLSSDSENKKVKPYTQNTSFTNSDVSLSSPEDRCRQLLQELELTEAADLYPAQLSGGMAQRVSLGRTLFYDPDLILMDEPFSALDYFTRRNLQDMVMRLFRHQAKTILFVTHDVEEALLLGDRILVMENGSIKEDLPVTLPFPRKAADSELQKMRQSILELLAE